MKKLSLFLITALMFAGIGISSETYAKDIIPVRPNVTQTTTIGMYQVGDDVKIYK